MAAALSATDIILNTKFLSISNRLLLYESILLSTNLLCNPSAYRHIWLLAARTILNETEKVHNQTRRLIRKGHPRILNDSIKRNLNIGPFTEIAREQFQNFQKVDLLPQEIIPGFLQYDVAITLNKNSLQSDLLTNPLYFFIVPSLS